MKTDSIKATGLVSLVLTDAQGNVKEQQEANLVVSTGLAFIASRMAGTASVVMSHMAIGTNATAASAAQTALITEAARVALTSSTIVTTGVANDSIQYVATFGAGVGTGGIQEAALLNASSAGTMLSRTVFSIINKGASDVLTITWKVTLA